MLARLAKATRAAARAGRTAWRRSIDVAGGSGRWPDSAMLWSPVNEVQTAARVARRRVAYLVENSPLAASIVSTFVTEAVADGPTVRSNLVDADEAADLEARFNDFATTCDIEGINDLGGYCSRLARGFMIDGEAFTHFAVDDDSLKLRYLASDQIDPARTIVGNMSGAASPRIVQGIEVDAAGRRTAYWVLPTAPDVPWASVGPPVSVPPMDIAHLFEPRFPGQLRGLSPLAPVATRLLDLDALEDAALKKAQISCLFAGFIRDLDNASGLAGDGKVDPATLSIEPGSLRVLPGGADVTFTQPSDMQGIDGTLKHMARSACAGASVPYMLASGDLAETSFSSAQVGQQAFRRRIRAFQSNCLVGQVLAPIWRRFVLLEVLTGRIRAPDFERAPQAYLTAKFIFRGWPATDPLKAAKADVLELNARIRSRTEIIGENGRDVSDVDAEIEGDPSQQDLTATATAALAQPEPSDGNA